MKEKAVQEELLQDHVKIIRIQSKVLTLKNTEKLLNRQLLLLHGKECKIYQEKLQKRIKYIIHITLYKVYYNIRNKENKQQRGKGNE